MALVTLNGTFLDPSGAARSGTVAATRTDVNRGGGGVATGTSVKPLVSGALPTTGSGALKVTAPTTGSYKYSIVESFADCADQTYLITVSASDVSAGIDLSTKP